MQIAFQDDKAAHSDHVTGANGATPGVAEASEATYINLGAIKSGSSTDC